jgi:hypothetical protein
LVIVEEILQKDGKLGHPSPFDVVDYFFTFSGGRKPDSVVKLGFNKDSNLVHIEKCSPNQIDDFIKK